MTHTLTIAARNEKRFVAVRRYRAECQGCPFRGEWRRSRDDAVGDADLHEATAEPVAQSVEREGL